MEHCLMTSILSYFVPTYSNIGEEKPITCVAHNIIKPYMHWLFYIRVEINCFKSNTTVQ